MPDATPLSLALIRAIGGSLLLFPVCVLSGQLHAFSPFRQWLSHETLEAFVGMLGFQLFFFAALPEAGVTVATVVTIGSVPVAVGVLGRILLGEKPSCVWYRATALALFSVALLGWAKGDGETGSAMGVGLAVAAGCSYGMFVVRSKGLLATRPPTVLMTAFFGGTALCLACVGVFISGVSLEWLGRPAGLGGAVFLAAVSTALAYILTLSGLRRTPVALAATLALGEPLGASVLGICLLGEPLGLLTGTGLVLLFVSMIMLGRQ